MQQRPCCTTKSLFITLGLAAYIFFFCNFPLRGKPDPVQETGEETGLPRGPCLLLPRALEGCGEGFVRRSLYEKRVT